MTKMYRILPGYNLGMGWTDPENVGEGNDFEGVWYNGIHYCIDVEWNSHDPRAMNLGQNEVLEVVFYDPITRKAVARPVPDQVLEERVFDLVLDKLFSETG